MFGLGNILGEGLLGGFFDKIGMPWMSNVISLATNVMTGNWIGAAGDVFNLVSSFSNKWMNSVDQQPPLGQFGNSFSNTNTNSINNLTHTRVQDITIRAGKGKITISQKVTDAFGLVAEAARNRAFATANLQAANLLGRI